MKVHRQYAGLWRVLALYWKAYGGTPALAASPFLHAAILMTALCLPLWWSSDWWEKSITILPSVLGFSIAAFALMLGVGDEGFRRRLGVRRDGKQQSTLTSTSTSLLHFIIVQIVALSVALIASSRPLSFFVHAEVLSYWPLIALSKIFRATGFFLLCYALLTSLAATLAIFRLATAFSTYATKHHEASKEDGAQPKESGGDVKAD